MKIAIPQLEVKENDAFTNDKLNRKPFGDFLCNLVKNSSDDGLVISINAKWGEGKTTFIKMWQGLLKESHVHSIYIDAFQDDYIDDSFLSIASTIVSYADEHAQGEAAHNLGDTAVTVAKHIIPIIAKLASYGLLGTDISGIIQSDLEKDKSSSRDKMFISYNEKIKNIDSFKKELAKLPSQLKDNTDTSNLVIIIDELDRCRPTFAIEMIEKIKHLFSVENIIFVLVMHKEQLEESIKCVYGNNIDAHTYLQKFINVETSLPEKCSIDNGIDKSYLSNLYESLEIGIAEKNKEDAIKIIACMAELFKLSLRQIEKIFTNMSIFFTMDQAKKESVNLEILTIDLFLCILKVYNFNLFKKLEAIEPVDLIEETKILYSNNYHNYKTHYPYNLIVLCLENYTKRINTIPKTKEEIIQMDKERYSLAQVVTTYPSEKHKFSVIPNTCQRLSTFSIND